jgi:NAD(P)-dependent dehydrogenase (short-subunit alcohol dehydrogenase family)
VEAVHRDGLRVGAIVDLGALEVRADPDEADPDAAPGLFALVQAFREDLRGLGGDRAPGLVAAVTRMDGCFGLRGGTDFAVGPAGSVGLLKSLAREWPEVRVRCIDLAPGLEQARALDALWEELSRAGPLEVGCDAQGRWRPALVPRPMTDFQPLEEVLPQGSVLLVIGGAYGIAAEAVRWAAARCRPRLVLLGRSPEPGPESPELDSLRDRATLRRYFLERAGAGATPAEVERRVDDALKARAIRATLDGARSLGAEVEYRQADARDPAGIAGAIEAVYARYGRIDGVIHAAGVIEDRLVADKRADSFARVYATKVAAARALAAHLRPQGLKFLVLYSSVAGRFGNRGQTDYAAANEVLNALALALQRRWQARVVAVGWGPWEAGMVSEGLERLYSSAGIGLIAASDGLAHLEREIGCAAERPGAVVVTRSCRRIAGPLADSVRE